MEEMPLTTSEVVQVLVGYILYFGVPILLYCYFDNITQMIPLIAHQTVPVVAH